ncbi:MFS transporter [Alkalihalobacillus sp. FSL R5-0424]
MATAFLIIIYLAFISLGLPDSLLGTAWPVISSDLSLPLSAAGVISMVIAAGTIISSLTSRFFIDKFGTGLLTFLSCVLTAGSLLGFAYAPSLVWFILLAIPLGLGGGAVDVALNNFVADNYKAHHMNWLHCFWGLGATAGPFIMSMTLSEANSWRNGYVIVSIIQCTLVIILLFSIPLWKRVAFHKENQDSSSADEGYEQPFEKKLLRLKGIKPSLASFMFCAGTEATVGLWGASNLVFSKGVSVEHAALLISLYYGGITIGRFITGFISFKVSNRALILSAQICGIIGVTLLFVPLSTSVSILGFLMIGLGLAPIYPALLHETPRRFGKENSIRLMGYQMAVAYTGSTFFPPIFGLLADKTTLSLLPFVILFFLISMLICSELVIKQLRKRLMTIKM